MAQAERIRPFEERDLDDVARMQMRAFRKSDAPPPPHLRDHFRRLFLENPWVAPDVHSIVLESAEGRVSGFLGILRRPFLFQGTPIVAGVPTQFMVDPGYRNPVAGLRILQHYMNGPQDACFVDEANDATRILFERLGGSVVYTWSLRWVRPLSPARWLVSMARPGGGIVSASMRGAARAADAALRLARRLRGAPKRTLEAAPLDAETLLACREFDFAGRDLKPVLTPASAAWLLETARLRTNLGAMRSAALKDGKGDLAGGYVHYARPGGAAQVMALCARKDARRAVLAELCRDAAAAGAVYLTGRVAPEWIDELMAQRCLLARGYQWTLAYSKDPRYELAMHAGRGVFTRLEGEWWCGILQQ